MTDAPLLTLVTGNKGKLTEIVAILGTENPCVRLETCKVDLDELQGESPEEIAKAKALAAYKLLGRPVLTEDTSLCFNALGGLPGPYIKWFLQKLGTDGIPKMLAGFEDKSGYASCLFTLCLDEETVLFFDGRCPGTIVEKRGCKGFGWDAIFEPKEAGVVEPGNLTYAEMTSEAKNKISHRARGLKMLTDYLASEEGRDALARANAKKPRAE